jgi:hypothetical protein
VAGIPFDPGAHGVLEHLMLWSGEWARRHEPGAASSEAESCPRGRQALERGGESPEGASGPRARWRIAQGGVRPSSEAEFTRRGTRSLSKAETRPRGTTAGRLVGHCGFFGLWAFPLWTATTQNVVLGFVACSFCVLLFFEKGFSPVIRGPLWLFPTHFAWKKTFSTNNHFMHEHEPPPVK